MKPLEKLRGLAEMFLERLQITDPLLVSPPKDGPALLVSDCSLGEYGDLGDNSLDDFVDEWKPSVHDDQGEALEPEWLTARVIHRYGSLWRRDGYTWRGIGHTGTCSPLPSLSAPITVVIDSNGTLVCDLSTIKSMDGDVRELLSDYLPPKAPRIVDRLAADEHDAQWISDYGTHWKWDNGRWWHTEPGGGKGIWVATPYGFIPDSSGPFTEATAQPLSWRGWAVPAILEVLADASLTYDGFDDYESWCEDVAPKIADRIACDPQRAMEALRNHQPDKVTR